MNTSPATGAFCRAVRPRPFQHTGILPVTSSRCQSSYRRMRSRLNVKPDPSFLPTTTESYDHIIYNAPPSSPNVYHTPTLFLPKTDSRRQLHEQAVRNDPRLAATSSTELPPLLREPFQKRYHLTREDMDEMRRLRSEDPIEWSSNKLAKKFDCSSVFVGFVTEGIAKGKREQQSQVLEAVKSRWGVRRRTAREDRALRKETWGRDA